MAIFIFQSLVERSLVSVCTRILRGLLWGNRVEIHWGQVGAQRPGQQRILSLL